MKTLSTTAILALMTASLGLSAIAPAMAQDAPAPAPTVQSEPAEPAPMPPQFGRNGPRGHGGFGDILGFERGAEGIEIALVRLSHAIELTTEQQALLETLKTEALDAAETFSTATESLRPQPPTEGAAPAIASLSERLEDRIAIQKAQLAALEAVQPSFTAFFDSLTEEQQASLMPQPGKMGGRGHGGPGFGRDGGEGRPGHRHGQPQG